MGIDYVSVGKKIKTRRKDINMTQAELAKALDISQGYIADLENGKIKNPSTDMLDKISTELGISLDRLLGESVYSIIENKLKETGMTIPELAKRANVSVSYINDLDMVLPNEYDYNKAIDIGEILNIPRGLLLAALGRQEPPVYDGPVSSIENAFKDFSEASLTVNELEDSSYTTIKTMEVEGPKNEEELIAVRAFLESYRKMKNKEG